MRRTENTNMNKGAFALSLITGFLFVFFVRTEADLYKNGNILWSKEYILTIVALSLGGALFCGGLYYLLKRIKLRDVICIKKRGRRISSKSVFWISFCLNILAYLPFFLAFYPGIMAYDFPIQLEQITTGVYNNHHPIAHTLLLQGCIVTGERLFGSAVAGVAIASMIQLLFLSLSLAFIQFVINEYGKGIVFEAAVQLLFCFQLFNGFLSVSLTKDIIFTSFVLLFSGALLLYVKDHRIAYLILVLLGGCGVYAFRNNGRYALLIAFIASIVMYFVYRKKQLGLIYRTLSLCVFASLITGLLVVKGLDKVTNATNGDKREMLSVPIQQLSRVALYEEAYLTGEEKALIDEFILYEGYKEYNPVISDPVKGQTNTSVVRYQAKRFLSVYLNLFRKYPGDYINAFLGLIGGYVSPFDETYRVMKVEEKLVTRNYIQHTFPYWWGNDYVYESSLLPGLKDKLDNFAEYDGFNKPILKVFYIPGIYLWIYLCIFIYIIDKSQYNLMPVWLFAMAYFATILLGPTMNLRYIYPLMVLLPMLMIKEKDDEA